MFLFQLKRFMKRRDFIVSNASFPSMFCQSNPYLVKEWHWHCLLSDTAYCLTKINVNRKYKDFYICSSTNNYTLTVSSLSQTWALDIFSPINKNIYEWNKTKQKIIIYRFNFMKIDFFLRKSTVIFPIISKKWKLKKRSEVKFYSSNFKSSYIFE